MTAAATDRGRRVKDPRFFSHLHDHAELHEQKLNVFTRCCCAIHNDEPNTAGSQKREHKHASRLTLEASHRVMRHYVSKDPESVSYFRCDANRNQTRKHICA